MMDFIMVPAIMAIITVGIYKLFELFHIFIPLVV